MRNVQVSAPMESEVVQVRLRGENAKEVTQIVNAVTQAYLNDVVNKEKSERLQRRDTLERKYKENMAEVRAGLDTYHFREGGHRGLEVGEDLHPHRNHRVLGGQGEELVE